jgi:hypothetical protein
MNDNVKIIGKDQEDMIMAYFKVPSHYIPITDKENYGKQTIVNMHTGLYWISLGSMICH